MTARPVAASQASCTDARCCWHLSRCISLGAAIVTVGPLAAMTSTGPKSARTRPFSVGRTCSDHSRRNPSRSMSAGGGAAAAAPRGVGVAWHAADGRRARTVDPPGATADGGPAGRRIDRRGRRPAAGLPLGDELLELREPGGQCADVVVGDAGRRGQLDEGDLHQDPGVGRVAQLDEDLPEPFDAPHQPRRPHALGPGGQLVDLPAGQLDQLWSDQRQEGVTQVADERFGDGPWLVAGVDGVGHGGEGDGPGRAR